MPRVARAFVFCLICTVCGCATYQPGALRPDEAARRFGERTLTNPALCSYLAANLGGVASCRAQWDLSRLTLAGFFYSPDLSVAQAQLKVAQAAVITAAQRPNPSVGLGPQYAATAVPGFAPWAIASAAIDFPIETAGKRGYRIDQARRLADAAAIAVGEAAWRVRSAVRAALLNYLIVQRQYGLAREYEAVSGRIARLLQGRVDAGAAAAPELNLALANLASARLKMAQAQSAIPQARNALAIAVGVPVDALQGAQFTWPQLAHPPDASSITRTRLQRLALLDRLDLRRTLAQYAAADAALKLEIARQYPDINLSGGYSWEVGENIFELLPIVTLPLMNRNQGPIAEARARRTQIATQFVALQDSIIGQANGALTRYRGTLAALRQASRSVVYSEARMAGMRRAADLGDIDSMTLATAQLAAVSAEQLQVSALAASQTALGAMEDAVQRPLEDGGLKSFTLPASLQNPSGEQTP